MISTCHAGPGKWWSGLPVAADCPMWTCMPATRSSGTGGSGWRR